jgi:hypothetical protein
MRKAKSRDRGRKRGARSAASNRVSVDRLGQAVSVGTRVRVLEVTPYLKDRLPAQEWQRLQSMVGEVFEVYEIDEYGGTWVEKWFESEDEGRHCHCLALDATEMEVVP